MFSFWKQELFTPFELRSGVLLAPQFFVRDVLRRAMVDLLVEVCPLGEATHFESSEWCGMPHVVSDYPPARWQALGDSNYLRRVRSELRRKRSSVRNILDAIEVFLLHNL